MKFALISHKLPPSSSGQAMVIYRMLREFDPNAYCLISNEADGDGAAFTEGLPGKRHHLPPPFRIRRGHRFGLRYLREGINVPLAVLQHARRLTDIIRREKCDAVVACTGDVTHLPAGYLASRRVGVPLFAYIFDHYSYREWHDPAAAFWARRFESRLMRNAAAVISPNEVLRDDLRERHGVEAAVIHNSFDITPYKAGPRKCPESCGAENGEVGIVYTGDVYEAHYDAIRNLMAAIESLKRPGVKLHLYTDRPPEELTRRDIRGPIVRHPHLAASEMPRVQMEADVLFLPLAFNSPYADLVRTSATTKLGEYLAARRPVIVHAPPDSFIARYFTQHECGVVVDRLDPGLVAQAIERVLGDADLRRRLAERAWEQALKDFDITSARARFWKLLGGCERLELELSANRS